MAADHLEFLKNKFINDFQEVVEEYEELPLRLHFQNILEVLQEKTISPSTPIVLKNPLYQVRSALTKCVMFAKKERERKAQNKKSRYNVHHVRKLWFLRKTGRKLVRIEAKLRETRDNAALESSPLDLSLITVFKRPSFYEPIFRPTIYGFDDQLQKIEKLLLKTPDANNINAVGIVGMGGVGKTALANEVFWRVQSQFDLKLWIRLSHKLNPEEDVDSRIEIVKKILEHFEKTTNHASLDDLLRALYDNLRDKRYLIVLDNVWHESNWYANLNSLLQMDGASNSSNLSGGLPKRSGGAIIVTSRLKKVAHGMVGEHNLVQLHPTLDEESCWSIFMDSIERKKFMLLSENGVMERMKEEIIYNCGGLPLAAMTLAEVISIQMVKEWFWKDQSMYKFIHLGLHVYDVEDLEKAIGKLGLLPGVRDVVRKITRGDCSSTFKKYLSLEGIFDPEEIVKQIEKFCFTEFLDYDEILLN